MNEIKKLNSEYICDIPAGYYDNIKKLSKEMGIDFTEEEIKTESINIQNMYECYTNCRDCKGFETCKNEFSGFVYTFNKINSVFCTEKCEKKKTYDIMMKNEKLIEACHIPAVLRLKSMKSFKVNQLNITAFNAACAQIHTDNTKGLILYGPTGTGKTHLMAAVMNNYIILRKIGIYATLPELMDDLRESVKEGNLNEVQTVLENCDVLFLDDIGTETPSDFVLEELFKIVNSLYLNNRKIIGTTNLDKEGLIEHYRGITGERIVSRLSEMCDFVEINGNDFRSEPIDK
jgi:DNA replication protein DnaC